MGWSLSPWGELLPNTLVVLEGRIDLGFRRKEIMLSSIMMEYVNRTSNQNHEWTRTARLRGKPSVPTPPDWGSSWTRRCPIWTWWRGGGWDRSGTPYDHWRGRVVQMRTSTSWWRGDHRLGSSRVRQLPCLRFPTMIFLGWAIQIKWVIRTFSNVSVYLRMAKVLSLTCF
jgi:hypothetical protein